MTDARKESMKTRLAQAEKELADAQIALPKLQARIVRTKTIISQKPAEIAELRKMVAFENDENHKASIKTELEKMQAKVRRLEKELAAH